MDIGKWRWKIIWIVGIRADDRFKITENNQKIYQITLQK